MKIRDVGYPQDIALKALVFFYANDERLNSELAVVCGDVRKYGRHPNIMELLIPDPLFQNPLVQENSLYLRLTDNWQHIWKAYVNVIPDSLKTDIETISKKWGLNSP
jgi:hypothetical protein